jgi:hypothetical protein
MLNILKLVEQYPFSEKELMRLVDHKANLVLYPDIAKYSTVDSLLGPHGACIILYITDINKRFDSISGHWTCLFKINKTTLEWFDPYAMLFDNEMDFSKYKYPPYLTKLLEKSDYNIIYNTHQLQRANYNISTCGRHVGMRLQFRSLSLPQYARMLESVPGLTPDNIVTLMTAFIK